MNIKSIFNVIISEKRAESAAFFKDNFNFTIVFESDWYTHLKNDHNEIAFMDPHLKNQPEELHQPVNPQGMIITLETETVDQWYDSCKDNVPIILSLRSEDWGQRHFLTKDPNGIIIDVVQMLQ